ncbi:conserved hypothetical protein [Frankia canadensis]|uniref:Uncharacterized protein n=1 Tax=Frankia canadensis TaxID=1836972 RepID=A0A2I2KWC9_9ACTN|nr:hypothetical protein [Frankia canadensis]SNQ49971.1 conserved hypothetical protein [Frankia canadensis]SOU57261.1 conserved hypothetical protein [Frankia canadensis]
MPMPPSAAALNRALLDAVARSLTWLTGLLGDLGWCDALPPWPGVILTAPADVYLLHAHALAVQYAIPQTGCRCHSGWRGDLATQAIGRWRALVDHALALALLSPTGRAADLQAHRDRYHAAETAFHRWTAQRDV